MFHVGLAEGKRLEVAAEDQFMAVGRAWENGCPQQPLLRPNAVVSPMFCCFISLLPRV